jgi:hypothetical protein
MGFLQNPQITADEDEVVAENKVSACYDDSPDEKFFQSLLHILLSFG